MVVFSRKDDNPEPQVHLENAEWKAVKNKLIFLDWGEII